MSDCRENLLSQAREEAHKLKAGILSSTKRDIIIDILREKPHLLAQVVSHFEPRIKVLETEDSFLLADAFRDKVIKALYEEANTLYDPSDEGERVSNFEGETEKSHIDSAFSKIVKQFIHSIPFLKSPVNKKSTGVYESNKFLDPNSTLQLLWKIYNNMEFNEKIEDVEDLRALIFNATSNNKLSTEENQILNSLTRFLFSEDPITYQDMYGNKKTVDSIRTLTLNPIPEIRERAAGYLGSLKNMVASVNNKSSLSYITNDGVYESKNDIITEIKASVNSVVAFNLYDTVRGIGENPDKIVLKKNVLDEFKDREINLRKDPTKGNTDKYILTIGINRFNLDGTKGDLVKIGVPFFLNTGTNRKQDVAVVTDFSTLPDSFNRAVKDKNTIADLFRLTGFEGVVDSNLIEDYINNPKNNPSKVGQTGARGPIEQLWNVLLNNIIALAVDISDIQTTTLKDAANKNQPTAPIYYPFLGKSNSAGDSTKSDIKNIINKVISDNDNPEYYALNQSKSFYRTFGSVVDMSKVDTFKVSPLMNYKGTEKVVSQLIASKGLVRSAMQFNSKGDMVNKNTIASNVEFIDKQFQGIRNLLFKAGGGSTGSLEELFDTSSVFNTDPFVNVVRSPQGIKNVYRKYSIEEMFREDGFNDEESGLVKSQMSMNKKEINYLIHKRFIDTIIKSYDFKTNRATKTTIYPAVYSDKSAFMAFRINTGNHNVFPITTHQLESETVNTINITGPGGLMEEFLVNDRNYKQASRHGFISTWLDSGVLSPEIVLRVKELVKGGNELESLEFLKSSILSMTIPEGPMNLVVNKYYKGNPGEKFSLSEPYMKFISEDLDENFEVNKTNEVLSYLMENHNISEKTIGLTFDQAHLDFLDKLSTDTGIKNYDNLKERKGISGMFYPKTSNLNNTEGLYTYEKGEIKVSPNFNQAAALNEIVKNINPYETAAFFSFITIAPSLNHQMGGSIFQYKGDTIHKMMSDMLKRSVQASAPYMRMTLDKTLKTPYDKNMPKFSKTILVSDELKANIPILSGSLQDKEIYDGGSLTNPLAQVFYQYSYGGVMGLFPEASFKFIYGNTDSRTEDNTLYKYAVHNLSEDLILQGDEDVEVLMKLFLGSLPFNRPVNFNVNLAGEININHTYSPEQSLWHLYKDLTGDYKVLTPEERSLVPSVFNVMSEFIVSSPNENGEFDLKEKFIPQIVFKSSDKTGQSNVHTMDDLRKRFSESGEGTIETFDADFKTIDNSKLGIQLQANHDPENTSVTIFSQAISNAVLEGRTTPIVTELFDSLAAIAQIESEDINRIFFDGKIELSTDENLGDISLSDLKLKDLILPGNSFNGGVGGEVKSPSDFNRLTSVAKKHLFIRSLVLDNMDTEGVYNTTYTQVLKNKFSPNDPQMTGKITSVINSYINKRTVSLSFPGGQMVVSPTKGLISVFDAIDTKTGEEVTIMRSQMDVSIEGKPRYTLLPGSSVGSTGTRVNGRDLKWKGYTKGTESIFDTSEYAELLKIADPAGFEIKNLQRDVTSDEVDIIRKKYKSYKPRPEKLNLARKTLQDKLINEGWEVQPAEFILPNMFKTKFGLTPGMQPNDVDLDYFLAKEVELFVNKNGAEVLNDTAKMSIPQQAAENKFKAFRKSLEVLVGRIPSTGPQSIVPGKVVGFIESSQNAIFSPIEMMMIQGADMDIDKSIVLSWGFNDGGTFIGDLDENNKVLPVITRDVKAWKNYHIQKLWDITSNAANALAGDTPVALRRLEAVRDKIETGDTFKFHYYLPTTIVEQKVLTAEGKAMVGVFANALKMYALTYYAYKTVNEAKAGVSNTQYSLKPVSVLGRTYNSIANINPDEVAEQAWEFYSELVNAATDNAKEMLLGAVGANLQAGNMISVCVMYGIPADTIFNFLSSSSVQKVLKEIAHGNDIDSKNEDTRRSSSIEKSIEKVINDLIKEAGLSVGYNSDEIPPAKDNRSALNVLRDAIEILKLQGADAGSLETAEVMLGEMSRLSSVAEEFAVGAKILSINRSLPHSPFTKFSYNQSLENFINKKISKKPNWIHGDFSMEEFLKNPSIRDGWVKLYDDLSEGVNILRVAVETPHISEYLNTKYLTDKILNSQVDSYPIIEDIIKTFTENSPKESKFNNISEDEYNSIGRYLNELSLSEYLDSIGEVKTGSLSEQGDIRFDLTTPMGISGFKEFFPSYLSRIKTLNPTLFSKNKFYNYMTKESDAKGTYLVIKNIDSLGENVKKDLQHALNNDQILLNSQVKVDNRGTMVPYSELENQLFLYSLIVGKGRVSKSSFFDLYETRIKDTMGYTDFISGPSPLKSMDFSKERVSSDIFLSDILSRYKEDGYPHIKLESMDPTEPFGPKKKNQKEYKSKDPETAPISISLNYNGKKKLYLFDSEKNSYGLLQAIYPITTVSANNKGIPTHTIKSNPSLNITDASTIEALVRGKQVELNVGLKDKITSEIVVIKTNLGDVKYDQRNRKGTPNTSLEENTVVVKSKALSFDNLSYNGKNKKASGLIVLNMINKLKDMFPVLDIKTLNSEEIKDTYGDEFSSVKGFVKDGTVVVNMDQATLDTALHEIGHVFLGVLKSTNPELYDTIVKTALEEKGAVYHAVKNKYGELNDADLGEEIFVTLLGYQSSSDFITQYSGNQIWVGKLFDLIQQFKNFVKALLPSVLSKSKTVSKKLENIDPTSTTLGELLNAISVELLSGDIKLGLNKSDLSNIKQSRDLASISTPSDMINSLIQGEYQESTNSSEVVLKHRASLIKQFVQEFNFKESKPTADGKSEVKLFKTKEDSYESAYVIKAGTNQFLKGDWNGKTDSLYYLNDLIGKKTPIKQEGSRGETVLDLTHLTTGNPNIMVKVRFNYGKIDLSLIDISNTSPRGYNQGLKRTNIFGNFIDDETASKLGITLRANQYDINSLRMGLIGMDIIKGVEGNVSVSNLVSLTLVRNKEEVAENAINNGKTIQTIVADLKKISEVPEFKGALSGKMKDLITDSKLMDLDIYKGDLLKQYEKLVEVSLYFTQSTEEKSYYNSVLELMHDRNNRVKNYQELLDALTKRQNTLLRKGLTTDKRLIEHDIISSLILDLSGIRDLHIANDAQTINSIQSYIEGPYRTGNSIFDFIYEKIVNAMNSLRRTLLDGFTPEHNKLLKEVMNDYRTRNPLSDLENLTVNDARKFFDPMFEMTEAVDAKTNKKVKVRTGKFIDENTPSLTKAQKEYIKFFKEESAKAYKAMYPDSKETPGNYIPLMKAGTPAFLKNIITSDNKWQTTKDAMSRWFEQSFEDADYFYERSNSELYVDDMFSGQFSNEDYQMNQVGLQNVDGDLILTDSDKNKNFETDLSIVLQAFVGNSYKKSEFDKIVPYIDAVKSFVKLRNEKLGISNDKFDDMLNDFSDRFMRGITKSSKDWKSINKFLNKISSRSSVIMLGFNLGANITNFFTGLSSNIATGIINTLKEKTGAQEGIFTAGDISRAMTINNALGYQKKLEGLNKSFGLYSADLQQMISRRQLKTDRGIIFNTKMAYWMNFAGDVFNRQVLLTAQMIKDGSWEAYSTDKEGNLIYDESKDKRFSGANGEALKSFIKTELRKENGLDSSGKMLRGYTNKQRNSLKVQFDRIHGSYDNETATNLNNYALGKMFLTFKRFMQNKVNQYFTGGKTRGFSEIEGRYIEVEGPDGKEFMWQGTPHEGLLISLGSFAKEIKRSGGLVSGYKGLDGYQKKNLIHLSADIALVSLIALAFAPGDDEEDDSFGSYAYTKAYKGSIDTFTAILNPNNLVRLVAEPFVAIRWYKDLLEDTTKVIVGDTELEQGAIDLLDYTGLHYGKSGYESANKFLGNKE